MQWIPPHTKTPRRIILGSLRFASSRGPEWFHTGPERGHGPSAVPGATTCPRSDPCASYLPGDTGFDRSWRFLLNLRICPFAAGKFTTKGCCSNHGRRTETTNRRTGRAGSGGHGRPRRRPSQRGRGELFHRTAVSYTHLRAHETVLDLVCRLLLEKKNKTTATNTKNQTRTRKSFKTQQREI